jgi:hypothetical protein
MKNVVASSAGISIGVTCAKLVSKLFFLVSSMVFSKLFRYAQYLSQNVHDSFLENPLIVQYENYS